MRPAVPVRTGLPERLEQPPPKILRQGWAGIVDLEYRHRSLETQADRDGRPGGTEVHGIVDELVEHLHDEIRRAAHHDGLVRQLRSEGALREGAAIRRHRGVE